jgi:hypothetical protein
MLQSEPEDSIIIVPYFFIVRSSTACAFKERASSEEIIYL